jgi:hypothetical protein
MLGSDVTVNYDTMRCDTKLCNYHAFGDRLRGLVVRIIGYRCRGSGSIPDATNFLKIRASGTGSTQPPECN